MFLATGGQALIQAAALIDLWMDDYVEPIEPPPLPYHILAQQVMALALQTGGIGRSVWFEWIKNVEAFHAMPRERIDAVLEWMISERILGDNDGILWLGEEGETKFGRKNFLELFSVFTSPPLFKVLLGRRELGFVDISTFLAKQDGPRVLLLGGRAWKVTHLDWNRRIAYVEAVDDTRGRSRWQGQGPSLNFRLAQQM